MHLHNKDIEELWILCLIYIFQTLWATMIISRLCQSIKACPDVKHVPECPTVQIVMSSAMDAENCWGDQPLVYQH